MPRVVLAALAIATAIVPGCADRTPPATEELPQSQEPPPESARSIIADTTIFLKEVTDSAQVLTPAFELHCVVDYDAEECANVAGIFSSLGSQLRQVENIVDASEQVPMHTPDAVQWKLNFKKSVSGFMELSADTFTVAAVKAMSTDGVMEVATSFTEESESLAEYKRNWCGDLQIEECA